MVTSMKKFLAGATIVGTIVPYFFFVQQISISGLSLAPFWTATVATNASTGFVADLFITSCIFWISIFRKVDRRLLLAVIAINLIIGLSAAFPFYLYKTYQTRN